MSIVDLTARVEDKSLLPAELDHKAEYRLPRGERLLHNHELAEIVASVEAAARRAYALGRQDALKEVVGMLHNEPTGQKVTALLAGPEPAPMPIPDVAPVSEEPGQASRHQAPTVMTGPEAEVRAVSEHVPARGQPNRAANKPEPPLLPWYLRGR